MIQERIICFIFRLRQSISMGHAASVIAVNLFVASSIFPVLLVEMYYTTVLGSKCSSLPSWYCIWLLDFRFVHNFSWSQDVIDQAVIIDLEWTGQGLVSATRILEQDVRGDADRKYPLYSENILLKLEEYANYSTNSCNKVINNSLLTLVKGVWCTVVLSVH